MFPGGSRHERTNGASVSVAKVRGRRRRKAHSKLDEAHKEDAIPRQRKVPSFPLEMACLISSL